jgi:hypothetical protein
VHPARQALPSVQVDAREDRLQEEEDPLEAERHAEHRAIGAHEPWPQQPHLERQDGSGDGTDGDQHAEDLRPSPREQHRHVIGTTKAAVLSHQDDRRERDPETRQNDMKPERGRHLCARGNHLDPSTPGRGSQHLHCVHRDT